LLRKTGGCDVRIADAGKSAARIAAVQGALDNVLCDGPEETILQLETGLILSQEPVKTMEQHPVKDGALRIPGTIDSRHCGGNVPRSGPTSATRPDLAEMKSAAVDAQP